MTLEELERIAAVTPKRFVSFGKLNVYLREDFSEFASLYHYEYDGHMVNRVTAYRMMNDAA